MIDLFNWLNQYSAAINAISTLIVATLTIALALCAWWQARATESATQVANAMQELEKQRDKALEPRVFIAIDGYHPETKVGSLVVQNSGGRSMFLRSLRIEASDLQIELFKMDGMPRPDQRLVSSDELRDLVITPDKTEKFFFKFKNGDRTQFELIAQLYMGEPVRLKLDTSLLNGYELRVENGIQLRSLFRGKAL